MVTKVTMVTNVNKVTMETNASNTSFSSSSTSARLIISIAGPQRYFALLKYVEEACFRKCYGIQKEIQSLPTHIASLSPY